MMKLLKRKRERKWFKIAKNLSEKASASDLLTYLRANQTTLQTKYKIT
jgi:hypothetical protein